MLHPFHWNCARDHLLLYKTGKWFTHPGAGRWSVTPFLPAPQRGNGFVRAASELQRFILKHLWGYIVQREEAQKTPLPGKLLHIHCFIWAKTSVYVTHLLKVYTLLSKPGEDSRWAGGGEGGRGKPISDRRSTNTRSGHCLVITSCC